jgi:predicted nucleic acid-binding protein
MKFVRMIRARRNERRSTSQLDCRKDASAQTTFEPLLLGLDIGEIEVLLLARELAPDWVLIDERLGRRVAKF